MRVCDDWQVIKENRLVIRGRHEERTSELVSKSKYNKEFDLGESLTLASALTTSPCVVVG